jgi:hypothetical protein
VPNGLPKRTQRSGTIAPGTTLAETAGMKWTGIYLVGYVIMLGGILAAMWKSGLLDRIGTTWTIIGVVIAIGIGIMIAVANSGRKENIHIDR